MAMCGLGCSVSTLVASLLLPLMMCSGVVEAAPICASETPLPAEGFVRANGIRLEYLDWGGKGPALIFIPGSGDDPHVFDDLAPAFTDRFHVIAYARRGSGDSEARPPYDTGTLSGDLLGLMGALKITKASLVGWSLGGSEITAMAVSHPRRVAALVYLDGAYDWNDPEYETAFHALPQILLSTPAAAMKSLRAYLAYEKSIDYTQVDDMRRIDVYLCDEVVVQPDGRVRPKIPEGVMHALMDSLWTDPPRHYRRVHAPALAFFAESMDDLHVADPKRVEAAREWESRYMAPFRRKSIVRVRRELTGVKIALVPGAHDSFFLTSRAQVVRVMREFLLRRAAYGSCGCCGVRCRP
jgi:pimeloyl-ACP methyl ester carboxylesterase